MPTSPCEGSWAFFYVCGDRIVSLTLRRFPAHIPAVACRETGRFCRLGGLEKPGRIQFDDKWHSHFMYDNEFFILQPENRSTHDCARDVSCSRFSSSSIQSRPGVNCGYGISSWSLATPCLRDWQWQMLLHPPCEAEEAPWQLYALGTSWRNFHFRNIADWSLYLKC